MKVNINKLMKYPSQAFEDLGAIDLFDDQDIETCIEEVMTINEEADFKELPLDELTGESSLFHLHSSTLFLTLSRLNR